VKGWSGLSFGPREFFLREACASGVVMQWPSWADAISTIRFIWTECLWNRIPNEVNRSWPRNPLEQWIFWDLKNLLTQTLPISVICKATPAFDIHFLLQVFRVGDIR
jgi:hypothetical protein